MATEQKGDPIRDFINSCEAIDSLSQPTTPPQLDIQGIIKNAFNGRGINTTYPEGLTTHKKPPEVQLTYLCSQVKEMINTESDIEEDQFLAINVMREAERENEESLQRLLLKKLTALCLIIDYKDKVPGRYETFSLLKEVFPTLSDQQLEEIRSNLIMQVQHTIHHIKYHNRD